MKNILKNIYIKSAIIFFSQTIEVISAIGGFILMGSILQEFLGNNIFTISLTLLIVLYSKYYFYTHLEEFMGHEAPDYK